MGFDHAMTEWREKAVKVVREQIENEVFFSGAFFSFYAVWLCIPGSWDELLFTQVIDKPHRKNL